MTRLVTSGGAAHSATAGRRRLRGGAEDCPAKHFSPEYPVELRIQLFFVLVVCRGKEGGCGFVVLLYFRRRRHCQSGDINKMSAIKIATR